MLLAHTDTGDVRWDSPSAERFRGFHPLTGNFLYCPNQFFDVCIPNYSRGAVRLVAFMLRKTLGWLDKNGKPIEQNIKVTYNEIITNAGVSRGAIGKAIDNALAGGFIRRTQEGRASSRGVTAQSASFTLGWDTGGEYVKDAEAFDGFYTGEGHRTAIPNAFFDHVIRNETLAVIKVIGAVLRHTVGYENQFGGRRSDAPLSYDYLQKYAHLLHRPTLAAALKHAIDRGYIRCVSKGCFDPCGGRASHPATYAINWLEQAASHSCGSKTESGVERFKNRTSGSSKTEPAERFKNRTYRKTDPNNNSKQQQDAAAIFLLCDMGFDTRLAMQLSKGRSILEIKQQIAWLPKRNPETNPLGMLRRAIEETWSEPTAAVQERQNHAKQLQRKDQEQELEAERKESLQQRNYRRERLQSIRRQFLSLSDDDRQSVVRQTLAATSNQFQRDIIRRKGSDDTVATEVLEFFARTNVAAS